MNAGDCHHERSAWYGWRHRTHLKTRGHEGAVQVQVQVRCKIMAYPRISYRGVCGGGSFDSLLCLYIKVSDFPFKFQWGGEGWEFFFLIWQSTPWSRRRIGTYTVPVSYLKWVPDRCVFLNLFYFALFCYIIWKPVGPWGKMNFSASLFSFLFFSSFFFHF